MWYGVAVGLDGRVTGLHLTDYNLQGTPAVPYLYSITIRICTLVMFLATPENAYRKMLVSTFVSFVMLNHRCVETLGALHRLNRSGNSQLVRLVLIPETRGNTLPRQW